MFGRLRFNTGAGNIFECVRPSAHFSCHLNEDSIILQEQYGRWHGHKEPRINVAAATEEVLEACELFSNKYVCFVNLQKILAINHKILISSLVSDLLYNLENIWIPHFPIKKTPFYFLKMILKATI